MAIIAKEEPAGSSEQDAGRSPSQKQEQRPLGTSAWEGEKEVKDGGSGCRG